MNESREMLSAAGEARREAMLEELLTDMAGVRRRRRAVRMAARGGAVTLMLAAAVMLWSPGGSQRVVVDRQDVPAVGEMGGGGAAKEPGVSVVFHTDETVVQRMAAAPRPLIERVDDAGLMATLREIGRPAGLIRMGARVALSAPVTDDELGLRGGS